MMKIFKSEIFKNVGVLVSGTILAQLIPIFSQVFLRRMYSPEDFGVYSVLTSILAIFLMVFTLRYDLAIVHPKSHIKSFNLVGLVFIIASFFLLISILFIYLFKLKIVQLLNIPLDYGYWLYFLPIIIYFMAIYKSIEYWLIRMKKFRLISINKFSRRFFESSIQLLFGFLKLPLGLMLGNLGGNFSNVLLSLLSLKKTSLKISFLNKEKILEVLKYYKEYPLFSFLPALLNTIALYAPIFIVNKVFGVDDTAQFDLTRLVLAIPSVLLSVSITQVYLQRFSSNIQLKKSIKKEFLSLFSLLSIISICSILIIYFWGEDLFSLIFGEKWNEAGVFAEQLIFKYALTFLVSPLSALLIAIKEIKLTSLWNIFHFLLIIALFFIHFNNIQEFFYNFIFFDVISYLVYLIIILFVFLKYERGLSNFIP